MQSMPHVSRKLGRLLQHRSDSCSLRKCVHARRSSGRASGSLQTELYRRRIVRYVEPSLPTLHVLSTMLDDASVHCSLCVRYGLWIGLFLPPPRLRQVCLTVDQVPVGCIVHLLTPGTTGRDRNHSPRRARHSATFVSVALVHQLFPPLDPLYVPTSTWQGWNFPTMLTNIRSIFAKPKLASEPHLSLVHRVDANGRDRRVRRRRCRAHVPGRLLWRWMAPCSS